MLSSLSVHVAGMQLGFPQAYQNGQQTSRPVSGRYTPLNRSLAHQVWAQMPASEPRKRGSAHSVGVELVYDLAAITEALTQFDSPQPPEAGGPGLAQPLLACADELSFQEDGFGVAPPQAGVAPPHPDPVPLVLLAGAGAA